MAGGRINNNVGWSRSSKLALLGLLLGGDVLAGVASVVAVVGRLLGIPEADGVAGDLLTLDPAWQPSGSGCCAFFWKMWSRPVDSSNGVDNARHRLLGYSGNYQYHRFGFGIDFEVGHANRRRFESFRE